MWPKATIRSLPMNQARWRCQSWKPRAARCKVEPQAQTVENANRTVEDATGHHVAIRRKIAKLSAGRWQKGGTLNAERQGQRSHERPSPIFSSRQCELARVRLAERTGWQIVDECWPLRQVAQQEAERSLLKSTRVASLLIRPPSPRTCQ
jgi:hypothetical protein